MSMLGSLSAAIASGLPGAYYDYSQPPTAPTSDSPSTLAVFVGPATDGVPNGLAYFSNQTELQGAFGAGGTTFANSLVREALTAMPELTNGAGIRVCDGTEASASMALLDAQGVAVLSFVAIRPGTNADLGSSRVDYTSPNNSTSPELAIALGYPAQGPETFLGLDAYATVGDGYDAPTFKANAIAAINGGGANARPSFNWIAVAGPSLLPPLTGVVYTASGGADGASGVTSAMLLGVDDPTSPTGAYAYRNSGAPMLVLCGITDPTIMASVLALTQSESPGSLTFFAFESGTTTDEAKALQAQYPALANEYIIPCMDWLYVFDQSQATDIFVSPIGAVVGTIAELDPWQQPTNKPYPPGKLGIIGTDRTINQNNVKGGEGGDRFRNGIMWTTNNMPRGGNLWGLPHGRTGSGAFIADIRMQFYIASFMQSIFGPIVGENQADDASDDTNPQGARFKVQQGLNALGLTLVPPVSTPTSPRALQAFKGTCNASNNPPTSVDAGYLLGNINAKTLTGVEIAFAAIAVGNQVQIQATTGS